MTEYLKLKESNCKHCYKCIRNCPVKAISFKDDQAIIRSEDCILCGQCFVACPQNAKEIRNDLAAAKALIKGNGTVVASIAPSFAANYDNITIGSMEKALKQLGFSAVEETAIGATIVKREFDALAKNGVQDVIISSCCPTVNTLIQKYYPKAIPFLAHVVSPMQAHSMDIKERLSGAKTVFIGPCISKKAEAESYPGTADCVLTFEELSSWLAEEGISFEPTPDGNQESRARLFPTTGGILRTMQADDPDYTYMAIDGVENCKNAIEDILNGKIHHCFIEMSACAGSCINGPAIDRSSREPVLDFMYINQYAGKQDFRVAEYASQMLKKDMPSLAAPNIYFSDFSIGEVLKKIGKTKPEDELNCGSCGYNTCREKAIAVLEGKADLTMCLPYLKEKAESFSDNIIKNTPNAILVLDEAFTVQQINSAACRLVNISSPWDVLGEPVVRILDPSPFMEASQKGRNIYDKRVYLPEYRKYVDQTIILDTSFRIIISIMKDVTEEALRLEQKTEIGRATIEIADKVIDKQMRSVQEIASLLGETAAETKVALTKLKELLKNE